MIRSFTTRLAHAHSRWQERAFHNDRDYQCLYWWGDRSGSAVGLDRERCTVCNPSRAAQEGEDR